MIQIGQKLKEERLKKRLTLEEVEKATKIRLSFLHAIENGDYQKLPSSAYAEGFVKNYASFLGLPITKTVAMFRREFDTNTLEKVLPEGLTRSKEFPIKRIRIGPVLLFALAIVALAFYLLLQYKGALVNPTLEIISPLENAVVAKDVVTVVGKTEPNTSVTVNNDAVSLDLGNAFKKNIDVFSGKTTITIKAVNRFGRQTIIQRHVDVKTSS